MVLFVCRNDRKQHSPPFLNERLRGRAGGSSGKSRRLPSWHHHNFTASPGSNLYFGDRRPGRVTLFSLLFSFLHTHPTADGSNEKVDVGKEKVNIGKEKWTLKESERIPLFFFLPSKVHRWQKRWEEQKGEDRLPKNSYRRCKRARSYARIFCPERGEPLPRFYLQAVCGAGGLFLSFPFCCCILMVSVVSSRFFRNGDAGKN